MLRTSENIIKRPIILTEKSTRLREGQNQVIFEVVPCLLYTSPSPRD